MTKKMLGLLVVALFLVSIAGAASAATLDLPKWVIVPEDAINFADVTLYCPLDTIDMTNNVTPCYYQGLIVNATITFNATTGYPKLVSGKIGNAFEFDGNPGESVRLQIKTQTFDSISVSMWVKTTESDWMLYLLNSSSFVQVFKPAYTRIYNDGTSLAYFVTTAPAGNWHMYTYVITQTEVKIYVDDKLVLHDTITNNIKNEFDTITLPYDLAGARDEIRIYVNKTLADDEIKLLYLAGRKKLSEPAQFRQIFSPMIDLTRDRATFYAGLEVSTTDPNGYVPVPESAVNMSITSAPKLTGDYTGAPFYYQGHYWYRADKIQFNLPIQFETVREKGGFSKTILLDEDSKTFVYEKEFKVTNPTAARLNVVYSVDPTALGFSVLQYPAFELDGIRMVAWQPQNSTELKLIHTDTLEPGEISTHWIKSIWTIKKEELDFPAKLEDFRNILDWQTAQRLAENAAKGKSDTYVKVIKIDSNADVSNVTILVPLKDESDVVEAVALTGSRETLQVEKLEDGKIVVKVPADTFVSGSAEIKVFYNKETSWWKSILDKIRSLMTKIKAMFFGGG